MDLFNNNQFNTNNTQHKEGKPKLKIYIAVIILCISVVVIATSIFVSFHYFTVSYDNGKMMFEPVKRATHYALYINDKKVALYTASDVLLSGQKCYINLSNYITGPCGTQAKVLVSALSAERELAVSQTIEVSVDVIMKYKNHTKEWQVIIYNTNTVSESSIPYGNNLYSVELSTNITQIDRKAFEGHTGLQEVSIPNSILSIGEYAFYKCSSLTSITLPDNITIICNNAFADCTSLTLVSLPKGLTAIGSNAFNGCSALKEISIPYTVLSIGEYAFADCKSLTSVSLPQNLTTIGNGTFTQCISLETISIPQGLLTIGNSAFANCTLLTGLDVPDSVTAIGVSAFDNIRVVKYQGASTGYPWGAVSIHRD